MQGIQHIIFDLGGVLLNIDYQLTHKAFTDLGIADFNTHFSQLHADSLFEDLETGKVSEEEFLEKIKEHLPEKTTNEAIITAWNAMLLDYPVARLQLLQQLRQHYNLFLLSNTNAIHLAAFNTILEKSRGISSLASFFDKTYYSHLVGLRKPGKEIYQLILDENDLRPEHTLFIDDTLPNVEAAKELGIQAIHLQAPKTILDIFRK
ncbi:HAD family hydrolase [Chitinophaga niabensis]|uniref:Putative hydrolase of the HAD superfamily n=1 Tax=Chitinophaga niabensis TaxID=536979 RepID=A0A1N6JSW4_9BACT|nr:HAD family phosphatase [Chitinophaga niabensis]SIO47390.1 putative hydrolase of the HAD superfamily [Chitinophaga niabensis]